MKASKNISVNEFRVASQFESLRKKLDSHHYSEHLEKPLAYWALPTDRRLPLVLLGRTLKDLLATPFADITATRGIGQKKIHSLVNLLARAASTDPAELTHDIVPANGNGNGIGHVSGNGNGNGNGNGKANGNGSMTNEPDAAKAGVFDPQSVSEVVWGQWRASVVRQGLGHERLGRLTPSLKNMTRASWNTRLDRYTNLTLADIRALKTHGEKRVCAILEVFHAVHEIVSGMGTQDHLVVRISPRRIDAVEQWIDRTIRSPELPDDQEIFDQFVGPLLEQLRVDATGQIIRLAENRLGISGPITSVREASRTMGLTRARLYQLLNEINDIIVVRWPHGRRQVYDLLDKLTATAIDTKTPREFIQLRAAIELFYPAARRGAHGSLEPIETPEDEED